MLKLPANLLDDPTVKSARRVIAPIPKLSIVLAAAALPIGMFGLVNGVSVALGVSAFALAAAAGNAFFVSLRSVAGGQKVGMCENALADLIENVRDPLIQFNTGGQVSLCTNSAHKLLGCESFELTKDGLSERVHILDRPLFMTTFSEARLDGKKRTIEVRMRRDAANNSAAPEFFLAEIFLSPNQNAIADAAPYAITATLRDVSEAKKIQTQMDDARRAAEEASLAKNRFLAVIGHELRTPLNAIVGFSDMMANGIGGKLDPTHEEYVGLISQSGHHLLEMVNMLLDMSKIEAGGFELNAELFEPEKLVAPCVQMVTKIAAEKNVEVDVELGRHLPEIRADERACRQMLLNLLSNAVKFTEAGGKVKWTMKQRGKYIEICVSDTGIGMDEAVIARLGEPFYQAQNSVDRGYEGTGLGISIVKGLVELHDGQIEINSALGKGTNIEIRLPINGPETKRCDNSDVMELHNSDPQTRQQVDPNQSYKRTA